jgi:putative inorganic carbon (HCO3(-)) transporter
LLFYEGSVVDLQRFARWDVLFKALPASAGVKWDGHTLLRVFAQLSLGAAIFFVPFRYRFVLLSRPTPPVFHDYTDFLLFLSDIFVLLALMLWGASLGLKPRRLTLGPLFLSIPLAGLLLVSLVSIFSSIDPLLSAYHFVRLLAAAGLYLLVVNEVKDWRYLLWGIAGGLVVQSVVSIMQILQQHSIGLRALGELELDPAWSGVSIVWAEGVRSLRAYGLSDHPNILGGLLAVALIWLTAWYLTTHSPARVVVASVLLLGLLALLLTYSRSAWLALCLGFILMGILFFWSKRHEALKNSLYLGVAMLLFLVPFLWNSAPLLGVRLNAGGSFENVGTETRSLLERSALSQAANGIFASHAVTGVGLGTFPKALLQVQPNFAFNFQPPHMVLLEVAAETGLFGAMFYLLVLVTPWLALWSQRRRLDFSPAFIAANAALLAITVISFLDYYPWLLVPGRFWLWMAWGLWGAFYTRKTDT